MEIWIPVGMIISEIYWNIVFMGSPNGGVSMYNAYLTYSSGVLSSTMLPVSAAYSTKFTYKSYI